MKRHFKCENPNHPNFEWFSGSFEDRCFQFGMYLLVGSLLIGVYALVMS